MATTGSISLEEINNQAAKKKAEKVVEEVVSYTQTSFYMTGLKVWDMGSAVRLYLDQKGLSYTMTKEDLYASGLSRFFGFQKERVSFVVYGKSHIVSNAIDELVAWAKKINDNSHDS